jgi:hypothetical protein
MNEAANKAGLLAINLPTKIWNKQEAALPSTKRENRNYWAAYNFCDRSNFWPFLLRTLTSRLFDCVNQ